MVKDFTEALAAWEKEEIEFWHEYLNRTDYITIKKMEGIEVPDYEDILEARNHARQRINELQAEAKAAEEEPETVEPGEEETGAEEELSEIEARLQWSLKKKSEKEKDSGVSC